MSLTATTFNLQTQQPSYNHPPSSFYRKKCKCFRVTLDALSSIIKFLFFKILAGACWLLYLRTASSHYSQMGSYFLHRTNHFSAYTMFGHSIINFSMNCQRKPNGLGSVNELHELKKIYGSCFDRMRKSVDSTDFPIQIEKLKRLPIQNGICLGASLDFISRFLRLNRTWKNWFENVERISQLFKDGGTPESQIFQILYHAQDTKKMRDDWDAQRQKLQKDMNDFDAQEKTLEEEEKKKASLLSGAEYRQALEKLLSNRSERQSEMIAKWKATNYQLNGQLKTQRIQPLASGLGLKIALKHILIDDDIREASPPEIFRKTIRELTAGAYVVGLSGTKDSMGHHAITYLKKSDNQGCIFDPNYATIAANSADAQVTSLWKLIKQLYNKHGTCTIQLFETQLAS